MSALFHHLLGVMSALDAIVADWGAINITHPTTIGSTADITLSWTAGGGRTISADYAGTNTFQYRINSGAWVTYSAPFSVSSGQTVGFRVVASADESLTITVTDATRGSTIDTFALNVTGFP